MCHRKRRGTSKSLLSSRVVKGKLDLESLKSKSDGEMLEALDEVLGIGPWTVHMLMIFTLGRTDVLPVDDLGIKKGIQKAYRLREMPKKEKIELLARNWHPYCSVELFTFGGTRILPSKSREILFIKSFQILTGNL